MFIYIPIHKHTHIYTHIQTLTQENKKPAKHHVIGLFMISVKSTFLHLFPELLRKSPSTQMFANLAEVTSIFFPECLTFTRNNEAEQGQTAPAGA